MKSERYTGYDYSNIYIYTEHEKKMKTF
jgi:hypothetical protein